MNIRHYINKEQPIPQKPNGTMIKKIRGEIFATEIYFNPKQQENISR